MSGQLWTFKSQGSLYPIDPPQRVNSKYRTNKSSLKWSVRYLSANYVSITLFYRFFLLTLPGKYLVTISSVFCARKKEYEITIYWNTYDNERIA